MLCSLWGNKDPFDTLGATVTGCLTDPAHLAPWFYFSQSKNDESETRIPVTILPLLEGDAPAEEQMICDIFTACIEYS